MFCSSLSLSRTHKHTHSRALSTHTHNLFFVAQTSLNIFPGMAQLSFQVETCFYEIFVYQFCSILRARTLTRKGGKETL